MLRGGDPSPRGLGPSTAVVVKKSKFPNFGTWRVTAALVMSGRPSAVTLVRSPGVRNAPPVIDEEPRIDGDAARRLEAEFRQAGDDQQRGIVLTRFLDTLGLRPGAPPPPSQDDAHAALTAASLLGSRIARCLEGTSIEPDAIRSLMLRADAAAAKPAPQLTLVRAQAGETVVSQARIKGGGDTRIAIAIVARARTLKPQEAIGRYVVRETAKWLERNLDPPEGYAPKC